MPRPKVLQESRQRIAKACLYCQMAKQKCDGHTPCSQCQKRGKSNTCAYSAHERSYGRRRREVETGHVAIHSSGSRMPSRSDDVDKGACRMTDVAIPKLPHNLYDTKGRVCMYPTGYYPSLIFQSLKLCSIPWTLRCFIVFTKYSGIDRD